MEFVRQANGHFRRKVHDQRSQSGLVVRGGPAHQLEQELRKHDHQGQVLRQGGRRHLHPGRGKHGAGNQGSAELSPGSGVGRERQEDRSHHCSVENLVKDVDGFIFRFFFLIHLQGHLS